MSGEPVPIHIPENILGDVYEAARAAFPGECCGWLTGPRREWSVTQIHRANNAQDAGGHPTNPERSAETAYVFSPADLLALNRSLDGAHPARVIYHSHPNGRAYLSDIDRGVAASPWGDGPAFPVQQLVVGVDEGRVVDAVLYAWAYDGNGFIEVARFDGAGRSVSSGSCG